MVLVKSTETGDSVDCVCMPKEVFIGKSPGNPNTRYGPEFDGNTILVRVTENHYLFVGGTLRRFATDSPIVKYVSEVGNNDVPYPYAVDAEGKYYLLIEDAVVRDVADPENPYAYLYSVPQSKFVETLDGVTGFVGSDPDEVFRHRVDMCPEVLRDWPVRRPWRREGVSLALTVRRDDAASDC